MGLGVRRTRTSCFCSQGCPSGTYPFEQYWVSAFGLPGQAYNGANRLYRIVSETPHCVWEAVEQFSPGTTIEKLEKLLFPPPPGFQCWQWRLTLFIGAIPETWQQFYCYPIPEVGQLVQPEADASCSKMFYTMPNVVLGPLFTAELRPAFPEVCDNSKFPAGIQIKPISPF